MEIVLDATRWAASASHLYGKTITSSETWTWLHSPVFRATPLDMKAEADLHFLQGVNQLDRARVAVFAAGSGRAGLAILCGRGVQRSQSVVAGDAGHDAYLQRVSLLLRQGTAGQRRGALYCRPTMRSRNSRWPTIRSVNRWISCWGRT